MTPTEFHFRTEDGATPLAEAARYGNGGLVQVLLPAQWTLEEVQEAINAATTTIIMDGVDPAQFVDTITLLNRRLSQEHTHATTVTQATRTN